MGAGDEMAAVAEVWYWLVTWEVTKRNKEIKLIFSHNQYSTSLYY